MANIKITFSDNHVITVDPKTLDVEDGKELDTINGMVEAYIAEHPGVYETEREYVGDDPNESKSDVVEEAEEKQKIHAGEDTLLQDQEYVAMKLIAFGGNAATGDKGLVADMDKEALLTFIDRYDFERTMLFLKTRVSNFVTDIMIKDMEEEKILNMMGHNGIVTSYNEPVGRWQAVLHLRDCLVVTLARTPVNAALRAAITRATGQIYNNNDVIDTMVKKWCEVHGVKDDPRYPPKETLDDIAAKCGTSIEEIEQDYRDKVALASGANVLATVVPGNDTIN